MKLIHVLLQSLLAVQLYAFYPAEVPDPIWKLLEWPTETTIRERSMSATTPTVQTAIFSADRWIRMVVDEAWLPAQLEFICIHNEFENRNVIRCKWTKAGRNFFVAQTGSIFVLEVRPEHGSLQASSKEALLHSAKGLVGQILAKRGKRWTGQGQEVLIPDLDGKITDGSFDTSRVKASSNPRGELRLEGRPKTIEEEGVARPKNSAEAKAQDDPQNTQWYNSSFAWQYWFKNVHWFAESNRLVLYFLKDNGGPVALSFGGSADDTWGLGSTLDSGQTD